MSCGSRFVYDLGSCDGPGYKAAFQVRKPVADSTDRLISLGTPFRAVGEEHCVTCGPYILNEKCLLKGSSDPSGHDGSSCGGSWQGNPGWTKQPSSYIGDDAVLGVEPKIHSIDTIQDRLPGSEEQKDLAGLGMADFEGLCGSYVTDGPTFDSVFVLHRLPQQMPVPAQ
mmetsp:Transcript_6533/g.9570  ORF Transcript_6533/g.9570 Transcript_6533/m.9570 type:complete len:169 (+) Transcript_6533:16-522(+)